MANSAHDDISLTIKHTDIGRYKDILSTSKFGDPGDAYALLNLIRQIEESKKDDATVKVVEMVLENTDSQVIASFPLKILFREGWLKHFPKLTSAYIFDSEAAKILEEISNKNFDISFRDLCCERPTFTLEELFENMDLFSIGRPSTIQETLSNMLDLGLIEYQGKYIAPTSEGLNAFLVAKFYFPKLATRAFSSRLRALQSEIETGKKSIPEALHELLLDITNGSNAHILAESAWSDIDELYECDRSSELVQGLIAGYR
jgi:DNA topoisomerase IA